MKRTGGFPLRQSVPVFGAAGVPTGWTVIVGETFATGLTAYVVCVSP